MKDKLNVKVTKNGKVSYGASNKNEIEEDDKTLIENVLPPVVDDDKTVVGVFELFYLDGRKL